MVGNILVFCQLFIVLYSFYINFKNSWLSFKTEILKNDPYAKNPVITINIILAIHANTFSTVLLNGFIINPSFYKIKGLSFLLIIT